MSEILVQKVNLHTREKIGNPISISDKEWISLQSVYAQNKNIRDIYIEVEPVAINEPDPIPEIKKIESTPDIEEPKKKKGRPFKTPNQEN